MAPPDTLPLPAFEDRLWDELAALHTEGRPRAPRRRFYAAAVASLAAAAAVIAVALVVNRDDDRVDTSKTPPVPDAIVVRTTTYSAGNVVTTWIDDATGRNRSLDVGSDGQTLTEDALRHEQVPDGRYAIVNTDVNHGTREWREYSTADQDPPLLLDASELDDGDTEAWSRSRVDDAPVEVVDGRELLRIDPENPVVCADGPCGHATAGQDYEISTVWLDPDTLRPVRSISEIRTLTQAAIDDPDLFWDLPATLETTSTYEYLPRTPENIALTEITIPNGYVELPAER